MAAKTWTIPVDSEGRMSFPEELLKVMGWEEGTVLKWDYTTEGTIKLKMADDSDLNTASPE